MMLRTFHLSMSSVSHGFSVLWVDGIVAAVMECELQLWRAKKVSERRSKGLASKESRSLGIRMDCCCGETTVSPERKVQGVSQSGNHLYYYFSLLLI